MEKVIYALSRSSADTEHAFGKRQSSLARSAAICAVVLLAIPSISMAGHAGPDTARVYTPLFSSHEPLAISIEAPLTTLLNVRPEEEYLDARISFVQDDGTIRTLDVGIRTRGNYRLMKKHCDFPPVKLNFRKKQVVNTVFSGQDKIKLVTHCGKNRLGMGTRVGYEQLMLREYIAYRILQVMTSKSYGVRLLQVRYIDTEGAKPISKFAFAIEDDEHVAARVGMQPVKTGDIDFGDIDAQQANLINVFQYLIGNTDYSLVRSEPGDDCCHNSDVLSSTGGPPFTPLPFDFDFAGLVNAPYAEPHPRYNIRNVRQRLFKGRCENNALLPGTLQKYLDKKSAIYAVVDEVHALSPANRRDVIRYLGWFYDHISKPRRVNSRLVGKCVEAE